MSVVVPSNPASFAVIFDELGTSAWAPLIGSVSMTIPAPPAGQTWISGFWSVSYTWTNSVLSVGGPGTKYTTGFGPDGVHFDQIFSSVSATGSVSSATQAVGAFLLFDINAAAGMGPQLIDPSAQGGNPITDFTTIGPTTLLTLTLNPSGPAATYTVTVDRQVLGNNANCLYLHVRFINGYLPGVNLYGIVGRPILNTFTDVRVMGWANGAVVNGVLVLYDPATGLELASGNTIVTGAEVWLLEEGTE